MKADKFQVYVAFAADPIQLNDDLQAVRDNMHSGRCDIDLTSTTSTILVCIADAQTCRFRRQTRPGEFTRQALLRGRHDLTQVDGLHDLIEATLKFREYELWAAQRLIVSFLIT